MFLNEIEKLKEKTGSYSKVAEQIGITRASLSAIKRGLTHPSDETIIKLCKVIGIEPFEMLAQNDIESSKGEVKKTREIMAKKLGSVAASILAITTLPAILNEAQCILC